MPKIDFELDIKATPEPTCNGIVYRYHESAFIGKNGRICVSKELRPLKRLSCPGCEICGPQVDCLQESVVDLGAAAIEFEPGLETGNEVKVVMVPQSYDWESGHLEEWTYVVKKFIRQRLNHEAN